MKRSLQRIVSHAQDNRRDCLDRIRTRAGWMTKLSKCQSIIITIKKILGVTSGQNKILVINLAKSTSKRTAIREKAVKDETEGICMMCERMSVYKFYLRGLSLILGTMGCFKSKSNTKPISATPSIYISPPTQTTRPDSLIIIPTPPIAQLSGPAPPGGGPAITFSS